MARPQELHKFSFHSENFAFTQKRRRSHAVKNGQRLVETSHQYEEPDKPLREVAFHSFNLEQRTPPQPRKSPRKTSRTEINQTYDHLQLKKRKGIFTRESRIKRPRKQENETYEPFQAQEHRRTFTTEPQLSGKCHGKDGFPTFFKILAFVGFLFALTAFAVSLMFMLGILSAPACQERNRTKEVWRILKGLKSNLTELEKIAHDSFFSKNLTSNSISTRQQETGARPRRPGAETRGKPVRGNFSLCEYRTMESARFVASPTGIGGKVIVTEPNEYRIVGVSCSTLGASEHNLKSRVNPRKQRVYECDCRGRSNSFIEGSDVWEQSVCIVHYWICPII